MAKKTRGPNRSEIRKSRRRGHDYKRNAAKLQAANSEVCLVVIDVPNINVAVRSYCTKKGIDFESFQYYKFERACRAYLNIAHPNKNINVELVAFTNTRDDSDYTFLHNLNNSANWTVIFKPKIGDSDIDDDIKQYVDFYTQDKSVIGVILVGNDLRNHTPIAHSLIDQDIIATMLCYFDLFYEKTKKELELLESVKSIQSIDIPFFMKEYQK